MFRLSLISFTALSLVAADIRAVQAQGHDIAGGLLGGIIGGIISNATRGAQSPAYAPQPQQQQGYVAPPNPQVQQQIDTERQRAATDAAEKVRQRQQAEADRRAKEQQAARKAQEAEQLATRKKAEAEEHDRQAAAKQMTDAIARLRADPAIVSAMGADPRDITALIVAKDTANVIRDLQGNPAFQSAPRACLPFGGLAADPRSQDFRFLESVTRAVEQKGGITDGPSLLATACDPADFGQYDLLIFSGSQVTAGSPEVLTALVDALRQRDFVLFGKFTVARFLAEEAAKAAAANAETVRQQAAREQAVANFQSREASVISAIRLESPAAVVCLMVPNVDGVRYLLGRSDQPFDGLIGPKTVFRTVGTANDMFIALKKRECTAAVAPAGALRTVIAALARDGTKVAVQDGAVAEDRLADWKVLAEKDLLVKQDQQARDLAERRRMDTAQKAEREQKQALENERRKHEDSVRQDEIAKMRKLVASKANAVADGFGILVNGHMATVHDAIAAKRQPGVDSGSEFQAWSAWYETQVKEQWEFGPVHATVEDYGRAQWKARAIEAIAVQVQFPIMNRLIGEKQTVCYQFIWINDEEFGKRRNPKSVPCGASEAEFAKWSQENDFTSQWKLLEGSE